MTAGSHFQERLLGELRRVAAETPDPRRSRRAWPRPARWGLAGAALALAATAVVVVDGGAASDAYAVQTRADGTVVVSIASLTNSAGLERQLGEAGVPASVDYTPAGRVETEGGQDGCGQLIPLATGSRATGPGFISEGSAGEDEGPGAPPAAADGEGSSPGAALPGTAPGTPPVLVVGQDPGGEGATFTVDPAAIEPGEELQITTSSTAGGEPGWSSICVGMGEE